jgi:uncharacterized membrane protein
MRKILGLVAIVAVLGAVVVFAVGVRPYRIASSAMPSGLGGGCRPG